MISQPFNRFKKRDKPRRKRPELFGHSHGERLRGSAKTARRRELFERSKGRCEAIKPVSDEVMREFGLGGVTNWFAPCRKRITWETMEWSHKRHAANKCDCMECGIASCRECHQKSHNAGGKPCPKKVSEPGQVSGGL